MRWFTADLHLGHTNIIGYCERPFGSTEAMDDALVAGWNQVVGPDDEVWVLGDLAMGRIAESLEVAAQLAGRKHLVVGNHDRPFEPGRRRDEWSQRYLHDGRFVDLHHGEVALELAGELPVRLCHFPYRGDSGDHDRFVDDRPADDGSWLLHGHVHERWRQRGRMINVGVDAWAGRPVAEDELVALIRTGEGDRAPLDWSDGSDRSAPAGV